MLKATKNSIIAFEEMTGLAERITISQETRDKFKDAGKTRKAIHPPPSCPLILHILSTEEYAEKYKEFDEHTNKLSLLACLTPKPLIERLTLEDVTSTISFVSPRINLEPREYTPYTPSPPIPTNLRIHKTKYLLRIQEFHKLIQPTMDRLEPVFKALEQRVQDLSLLQEKLAEEVLNDPLWEWFNQLQVIERDIEEIGHKFKNGDWRKLKGACK
ncbi:hypothetical protein P691DRAFT_769542 [Macrolepiota fuliginosa MF-IS2]|uniref:Uncharacterized protein n=1 Tax=Macrolepiota fuliginosa MF-IS2 TaxID=1400762 RepID=A0A9P5WWH2_9AGAR|nr:hypothetical protein P691DRAFT_769542 [Macrolepiota fuliginosa MF-IS2]